MKICVVNASQPNFPQMNDSYVDFRDYNTWEDARWRSWHSIPASLKTEFFAYNGDNFHRVYEYDGIIILFNHSPGELIPLVKKLQLMKKKVIVGFHEGVDEFLLMSQNLKWFEEAKILSKTAGAYLSLIPEFVDFFKGAFEVPSFGLVYGSPFFRWKNPPKSDYKEGILIGTRTINQRLRRNSLLSILSLKNIETKVTYLNQDGPEIASFLQHNFPNLNIINGALSFIDWLKLISQHELLVQYDMCSTVGGVVQDAALVDTLGVGGNTSTSYINGTQIPDFGEFCSVVSHNLKFPSKEKLNIIKQELCFDSLVYKTQEIFKVL